MGVENNNIQALQIRFPLNMYQELKKRAKKAHRSLNSEVLLSIDQLFEAQEKLEKEA